MKRTCLWMLVVSLLIATARVAMAEAPEVPAQVAAARASRPEERLIRAAYARLSRYHKAFLVRETFGDNEWLADSLAVKFDLRDFRTGSIDDLRTQPWSSVASFRKADLITFNRVVTTVNGGDEMVSYGAEWTHGVASPLHDDRWTVGEVMAIENQIFHDVQKYTTYEVTVSLEGRSRTYRAMAVFHNRFDPGNDHRPDIVDSIVGANGALMQLMYDSRPPYRGEARHLTVNYGGRRDRVQSDFYEGEVLSWRPRDSTDHWSGSHGADATFRRGCEETQVDHRCFVMVSVSKVENGITGYTHALALDQKEADTRGSLTQEVQCAGAVAVIMKPCVFTCGTSVTVGISGNGLSATATIPFSDPDSSWKAAFAVGMNCDKKEEEEEEDNCSNTDANSNIEGMGGTELVNSTSSCGDNSPILIDVSGDGYALTSLDGGVLFDLNSDGVRERLSWTAAGSDDAFLVVDRDGNGAIDNGRELFGNFAPQYPSPHPNGFLALAVYDRPADGGDGDGVISNADRVFSSLRLWRDANHDGVATADELRPLSSAGIERLHVNHKESRRVDEHGNEFRYRAKVDGKTSDAARWAWDVYFLAQRY